MMIRIVMVLTVTCCPRVPLPVAEDKGYASSLACCGSNLEVKHYYLALHTDMLQKHTFSSKVVS